VPESLKGDMPEGQKERLQQGNKKLNAQLPLLREVDSYENPSVGILLRLVWKIE
jgi:hypothetical protein